jgi:hypothetical protein
MSDRARCRSIVHSIPATRFTITGPSNPDGMSGEFALNVLPGANVIFSVPGC